MVKFGYSINKDNQIDFDRNDRSLAILIREKEPTFGICINCGSCTASCSASNFTGFNFRKMCLLVRRGEVETVRQELSKCMLCGKCSLVCPRGVNTRNIIISLQEALINQYSYEL
jgi:heterodisulfide reductase subunit C